MKRVDRIALLLACAAFLLPASGRAAEGGARIALILDASGSMWGQIQGENKIVIARRVLQGVMKNLPAEAGVGLVAYGHRDKSDCNDIETVVPYGSTDRAALAAQIAALNPKGMTPITATLEKVFADLRQREGATTVILVSDGLETCGGDPCNAVAAAKAAGIEFILHVVGFDLGKENVAQLECAAVTGGGLYLSAGDAGELGKALEQAIEISPETPTGKLSVRTIAEGNLTDTTVEVIDAASGEIVTALRTYESPETNPRIMPLPDGTYDVVVSAVRISGRPQQKLSGVVIADGTTVEKTIDFGTGAIRVKVTRNGALSDASVSVYTAGTRSSVASGRTYRATTSNPLQKTVVAGTFDIEAKALEIANQPVQRWEGIDLAGGKVVELEHEFPSGTLRVGTTNGEALVDSAVSVTDAASGASVTGGRTYDREASNPKSFTLSPGRYRVKVRPVKADFSERQLEIAIEAGGEVTQTIDYTASE